MKFCGINNTIIHYADSGVDNGPSLVFVNSLGTDFRLWDAVYSEYESRFRVIRYDKRGHGLSDVPPGPYTLQDHIEDLSGLLDMLAVEEVIICGVSVGGLIAQGFCAQHPARTRALVLCDTAAKIGSADLWNDRIARITQGGIASIAGAILERWFSAEFRSTRKTELAGWRNMLVNTPAEGYTGTAAAIRDTDFAETARSIAVPVLVLCGDEDGATPPEVTRALTDLIEDSRFVLVRGCGHLPSIEQPEFLVATINAFLEEKSLV